MLTQNLHASVDAVLKDQEVSQVDYAKLTQDNQRPGRQPRRDGHQARRRQLCRAGRDYRPAATDPATQPGTDPGTQPGDDPGDRPGRRPARPAEVRSTHRVRAAADDAGHHRGGRRRRAARRDRGTRRGRVARRLAARSVVGRLHEAQDVAPAGHHRQGRDHRAARRTGGDRHTGAAGPGRAADRLAVRPRPVAAWGPTTPDGPLERDVVPQHVDGGAARRQRQGQRTRRRRRPRGRAGCDAEDLRDVQHRRPGGPPEPRLLGARAWPASSTGSSPTAPR